MAPTPKVTAVSAAARVLAALCVLVAAALATLGAAPPERGLATAMITGTARQVADRLREPLPLDVALSLRSHNGRSPIDLSPDGQWVAHTIATTDTVPRDSLRYAATGFPFAEGDSRMEATLTHTRTGETIRLGSAHSSSWAATWAPGGRQVAFYSDEGGEAGLWIWRTDTRAAERVPDVVVRPFFGFEVPRWSADGRRLLVKLVPDGMTVADLNALGPQPASAPVRFPEVEPGQPSVNVRRVEPGSDEENAEGDDAPDPGAGAEPVGEIGWTVVDLAIVDVAAGSVSRIVENQSIRYYAFSPDDALVAYSVIKGHEPTTQQSRYDLAVHDLADGASRTMATNLRLGYGIEWSWTPDGEQIAYFPSGQMARRAVAEGLTAERMVLVSVTDGVTTTFEHAVAPIFDPGDGEHQPLWAADGSAAYGLGDGDLWQIDIAAGTSSRLVDIPGWHVRAVVSHPHDASVWLDADGMLWCVARQEGGGRSALFAVDPETGSVEPALQQDKSYLGVFNLDASDATGELVFVATGQQELHGIWMFDARGREPRQATSLNPSLERYELGEATTIGWRGLDGQPLRGALLLPPGYTGGEPLPLVVWVYAGSMGSSYVNRFGFMGSMALLNMHVLATRGYAVLFPDVPVGVGSPVKDLVNSVIPGVNAAIDQGYADPDRLAIMGQSYGSYNTLVLITQTNRFKAAVITAAVLHPDLFADYLGGTGYYEEGQGAMGGTIWEYPDRYRDNSPLFLFDRIETPLLIGQGENDGDLVPAEAIFSALERLGKPVEYRLYEGEGHVLTQPENVRDFWQRRLEFLARHLGLDVAGSGRVSPR